MTDIVERLRELEAVESELALECDCPPEATANYRYAMTCAEAADTITALRAENERLKVEAAAQYADGAHDGSDRAQDLWAGQITALRAENYSLAAWQCVYTDGKTGLVGDEHGNQYCAMAKRVEALRAENERLRAALEEVRVLVFGANRSEARYPLARAALEEKQ